MFTEIQKCFRSEKILYSKHARDEMRTEVFGRIREEEVFEAVMNGEVIEVYRDDKPYPSMLIYGRTDNERPLHIVCAYSKDDNMAIIITVYHPDPNLWIDYKRRKK